MRAIQIVCVENRNRQVHKCDFGVCTFCPYLPPYFLLQWHWKYGTSVFANERQRAQMSLLLLFTCLHRQLASDAARGRWLFVERLP
jgi:hypothetical protein